MPANSGAARFTNKSLRAEALGKQVEALGKQVEALGKRVAIVVMPFVAEDGPALGPSLIHAAAKRAGFECRLHYFNLLMASAIGLDFYREIDRHASWLLGEWLFRDFVFDDGSKSDEFIADVLKPASASDELLSSIPRIRARVPRFLDECMAKLNPEALDVIGFSSTFQQNMPSLALAKRIKANFPHVRVVIGGANTEGSMGKALFDSFPFLDAVFSGEADLSFPAYLENPSASISGVIADRSGVVARSTDIGNSISAMVKNLDALPSPDFADYYEQLIASNLALAVELTHLKIETSRGCWWGEKAHCTFCGLNGSTMAFRRKTTEVALKEFQSLMKYPTRSVLAADNILDHRAFDELIPALSGENLGLRIFFETKSNMSTEDVRSLERAGVVRIQPGIESLSTRILGIMKKGCRAIDNIHLLRSATDCGLALTWNYLCGFPGEEEEDYAQVVELLPSLFHLQPPLGLFPVQIHRFSPYHTSAFELGFGKVRPIKPYSYVYGPVEENMEGLAYFFEPEARASLPPSCNLLGSLITEWRLLASRGASVLPGVADEKCLRVVDGRRPGRRDLYEYQGITRSVLLACSSPLVPKALESQMMLEYGSFPESALSNAVADLIEKDLLLLADGYLLTLPLIRVVEEGSDLETACDVEHEIQRGRMASLTN